MTLLIDYYCLEMDVREMDTLWRSLPKLYYSMRKSLFTKAKECGLEKGQPRILDFVSLHDGCIQREIGEEYSLEAPSVSNFLKILEEEGVLRRERDSQSSRKVNVYITDKGIEIQKRLNAVYDELEEISFQGFSQEEREQFISSVIRITQNMMQYNKAKNTSQDRSKLD